MEETVSKIIELIKTLQNYEIDTFTPDTLSAIAIKLAVLKAGLGDQIYQVLKETKEREAELKSAKSTAYRDLRESGLGAGDSKESVNAVIADLIKGLAESEARLSKLQNLSYNVHDIIEAIRSRIINQQMEKREVIG